jgi:hypothetical protein
MVRYVNTVKGRPPDQTGSVVTTPDHAGRQQVTCHHT